MMHNSPLGMGIAWEKENTYWIFDGYHSSITRYSFNGDHGPGGTEHDDGEVARMVEGQIKRFKDVPSHMEFDHSTKLLYIADTGNNRVAMLDSQTGYRGADLPWSENYDCTQVRCSDYHRVENVVLSTFADGESLGLTSPSGLALYDGNVYISDNATSTIYAFNGSGEVIDYLVLNRRSGSIMGIEFDSQGWLYVVDNSDNEILRIEPKLTE